MAVISQTSRVVYYDVNVKEMRDLLNAAAIMFGTHMQVWVKGTFEDKSGELAFCESGAVQVDLNSVSSRSEYFTAKVDGQWTRLKRHIATLEITYHE